MEANKLITANQAIAEFQTVQKQIAEFSSKIKDIVVSNEDSLTIAEELAKQGRRLTNTIDDRRKEMTKPYLDTKKEIDTFAKQLTSNLEEATSKLRSQILNFKREQEKKKQAELKRLEEEQRKREEEERKKQEQIEEETGVKIENSNTAIEKEYIEKQKELNQSAPKGMRKVWTFKVTDEEKIPREFLTIDESKIKQAIKNGARKIAGLNVFQKEQLHLR